MIYSIAHRLWRLLPQNWRRRAFTRLTTMAAPRPDPAPAGGLPVGIVGVFRAASGLGEGARLAYAALEREGLAPAAADVSASFNQAELPPNPNLRPLLPGSGGSLIVHINGPSFAYGLSALGRAQVKGRRIVGYWAWELPRLPKNWDTAFAFVHEIWVPSSFTRDAIAAATRLPVRVVPHPLEPPRVAARPRSEWGLPDNALVVLNIFHFGSTFARKNPLAAIEAFRRAYGDARDKILVIKIVDPGLSSAGRQELRDAIANVANIRVIDRTLSADDMNALMATSNIVISLHRSEGFGLVPAQAMMLGKPVVATAWSGNLDFMTERNAALVPCAFVPADDPEWAYDDGGQVWAEPDVAQAAQWLRRLADDATLRARLGAAAAADVSAQFAPARFAKTVRDFLTSARSSGR